MPSPSNVNQIELTRTGVLPETIQAAFLENLNFSLGRTLELASLYQRYQALALSVRDRLMQRWVKQLEAQNHPDVQHVAYLSAEFLMGPHLGNNLLNLDITENTRTAMAYLGIDLMDIEGREEEPGLGNGGLGRLAACYLDSLATLGYPATGYGIRYEFGIFEQFIRDGWQEEVTDKWLHLGNIWELPRPEHAQSVKLGGRTESYQDEAGRYLVRWLPERMVVGIPYDTPVLGYRVENCALLRLWSAEAAQSFDFAGFNRGDYYGAVQEKIDSETISKVLYPNDEQLRGKQLRLEQQYFFVACSIKDMIRVSLRRGSPIERFHEMNRIQLNDTHPAIAVVELMRQLVDKHGVEWSVAWDITRKTMSYTNHTLLPEALEKWPYDLFNSILPRHMELILEINGRFLDEAKAKGVSDSVQLSKMSIIDETGERYVKMANLAVIGSHAVNGVAALHSSLVKTQLFPEFFALYPERFFNVTNGVTPRRFMALSNPKLSQLIDSVIGPGWLSDLNRLQGLERYANDKEFQQRWRGIKRENKGVLSNIIEAKTEVLVNPDSLFDVQVKRIHEYKRQHLNVLHIIALYLRIKNDPNLHMTPRTFIFGGKAAPGYAMAKLIIKLINSVATVVNHDPEISNLIKVVFLPDYNVKNAQYIYPAADLSEQISTAGKEASGTGNMKLSMNGALTIGTLDGANIEIRERVGDDHFFLFGSTTEEVVQKKAKGYRPKDYFERDRELRDVIESINNGLFSEGDTHLFHPLTEHLLEQDDYLVMADFRSYVDIQAEVDKVYQTPAIWIEKSILNVARMGYFSSDRAVRQYADDIWGIKPMLL
jgi:starch phosphorylase